MTARFTDQMDEFVDELGAFFPNLNLQVQAVPVKLLELREILFDIANKNREYPA